MSTAPRGGKSKVVYSFDHRQARHMTHVNDILDDGNDSVYAIENNDGMRMHVVLCACADVCVYVALPYIYIYIYI